MKHVKRGARYLRVCAPSSSEREGGSWSRAHGGRWNPKAEFGALYLSATIETARASAEKHVRDLFGDAISIYDLAPKARPELHVLEVQEHRFVDAVTDAGIAELKLPKTFPRNSRHAPCQDAARAAYEAGEAGIAARSAAYPTGEELAIFERFIATLTALRERVEFPDWFEAT